MIKKIFLVNASLLLLLSGCGDHRSAQPANTGSIAFNVEWRGVALTASATQGVVRAQIDCAASNISTVEAVVYDGPTSVATGGPWSCSAHAGSITNVPPANNYKVTITGKDSNGNMMAYGELSGLIVYGGQTTDAGTIAVSAITTIASGLNTPKEITTDGTNVYWTEYNGTGAVKKMGINGGTVTTLAQGVNFPLGIAVDANNVYWTAVDNTVNSVPISGGTPTALVSTYPTVFNPMGIAVDSMNVYWVNGGNSAQSNGSIWKVLINGGTLTSLASGLNNPYGIAVDSTSVYWAEESGGTVKKVPIIGGTVITLASGQSGPYNLAIDSTSVYWSLYSGGGAAKVGISVAGGTVTTLSSGQIPNTYAFGIAVDATNVYWVESTASSGTIKKVGINGGTVTTLAPGMNFSYGLAADATSVYWTEQNVGNIKKVLK